jgi:hypothetical protein
MAIVRVNPDPEQFEVVQVDCDASNNRQAILEVEDWASRNNFVRVNEYSLRRVLKDGKLLYRAICYKITPEIVAGAQAVAQRIDEIAERMPVTPHSNV